MENVSKALIIAGSILISILLISGGILIFNSSRGTKEQSLKASETLNNGMSNATLLIEQGISKSINKNSITFIVEVISAHNNSLKTITYTCEDGATWEEFVRTANNSDSYYTVHTYYGGRTDVVLLVNGVERYGIRTDAMAMVKKNHQIIANMHYYAMAFTEGW